MTGQSATSSFEQQYDAEANFRSILALNNLAVDMAERSCTVQAFQTLRDAVFLAKNAFPDSTEKRTQSILHPQDIQVKLEDAYKRAANPAINKVRGRANLQAIDLMNVARSDVLNDVEQDLVLSSLIRTDECVLGFSDEDFRDIPILIVMHNFAIVSLTVARSTQHKASQAKLLEGAVNILIFLGNKLALRYEHCEDSLILPFIIFLSMSTLKALAFALDNSGREDEAASCLSTIENFKTVLCSLENYTTMIMVATTIAPLA